MIGHHGVSSFKGLSFAKEGGMPCVTMRVLRNTMYRSRSESTLSLLNGWQDRADVIRSAAGGGFKV